MLLRWYRCRMKPAALALPAIAWFAALGPAAPAQAHGPASEVSTAPVAQDAPVGAGAPAQPGQHAPRPLLVEVRDTPPRGAAAIRHGADGSYALSTGGAGERDERAGRDPDNGSTLSTSNAVRRVHVLEGERVRVDLPAVQSLQFHVPIAGSGTRAGSGAAKGGGNSAPGGAANSAANSAVNSAGGGVASGGGPAASGVVYFEAVAAFAARFGLAGATVRIELAPLRQGSIAAPYAAAADGKGVAADAPVVVTGKVGEWIALGDADLQHPRTSLNATAEPASPASVWVRVNPDASASVR